MTAANSLRLIMIGVAALCVTSCAATDPLNRIGLWQPNGANEQNLRVMAVNQGDLSQGRGEPDSDGAEATAAIQRLRTGKLKDIVIQSTQNGVGGTQ